MLRISYIKKTCPQCGNVYKICKSETQTSVGSRRIFASVRLVRITGIQSFELFWGFCCLRILC